MAGKLPGKRSYIKAMTPLQQQGAGYMLPFMSSAVDTAENDKLGLGGVRSIAAASPEEAKQIKENSIINNISRWIQVQQGTLPKWDMPTGATANDKFVDFMQKRWAPIGAENDPKGLNKNWAGNVRGALKKKLGEKEYRRWQLLNIVRANALSNSMAA